MIRMCPVSSAREGKYQLINLYDFQSYKINKLDIYKIYLKEKMILAGHRDFFGNSPALSGPTY